MLNDQEQASFSVVGRVYPIGSRLGSLLGVAVLGQSDCLIEKSVNSPHGTTQKRKKFRFWPIEQEMEQEN